DLRDLNLPQRWVSVSRRAFATASLRLHARSRRLGSAPKEQKKNIQFGTSGRSRREAYGAVGNPLRAANSFSLYCWLQGRIKRSSLRLRSSNPVDPLLGP